MSEMQPVECPRGEYEPRMAIDPTHSHLIMMAIAGISSFFSLMSKDTYFRLYLSGEY